MKARLGLAALFALTAAAEAAAPVAGYTKAGRTWQLVDAGTNAIVGRPTDEAGCEAAGYKLSTSARPLVLFRCVPLPGNGVSVYSAPPTPVPAPPAPVPAPPAPVPAPPAPTPPAPAPGTHPGINANPSSIPAPRKGYTTEMVSSTGEQPVYEDGTGKFRTSCLISHYAYDDPIVSPGAAGTGKSHLHQFWGRTGVLSATPEGDQASTCRGGIINLSKQWAPTMLDKVTKNVIPARGVAVYYHSQYAGLKPAAMQNIPAGLKMIVGNSGNASPAGVPGWYKCEDGKHENQSSIPTDCPTGETIVISIFFPQCLMNGQLDSPDHKSHLTSPKNGVCPSTHPIAIPAVSYQIYYTVPSGGTKNWRLASDTYADNLPGGYSLHGDYEFGWKPDVEQCWMDAIVRKGLSGHSHLLGCGKQMYGSDF